MEKIVQNFGTYFIVEVPLWLFGLLSSQLYNYQHLSQPSTDTKVLCLFKPPPQPASLCDKTIVSYVKERMCISYRCQTYLVRHCKTQGEWGKRRYLTIWERRHLTGRDKNVSDGVTVQMAKVWHTIDSVLQPAVVVPDFTLSYVSSLLSLHTSVLLKFNGDISDGGMKWTRTDTYGTDRKCRHS